MAKPGRPFGLSIAIVASVVQFTLLPVVRWLWVLGLQGQFNAAVIVGDGSAYGGGISSPVDNWLITESLLGLGFLIIAVMTWRGKPPVMRYVFSASVILLTLLTVAQTLMATSTPQTIATGIDSGAGLANVLLWLRMLIGLLLALYVAWFANRAPSRAFFRGYYLSD